MSDDLIDAIKSSITMLGIKGCITVMGVITIMLISSASVRTVVVDLEVFDEIIFYNIVDENPDMANRTIIFEIQGDCVNFRILNDGWYCIFNGRTMTINTNEVQIIQFLSYPGHGYCEFKLSYNVLD
jgi:hypothetical protein